jgi:hypothetical protein
MPNAEIRRVDLKNEKVPNRLATPPSSTEKADRCTLGLENEEGLIARHSLSLWAVQGSIHVIDQNVRFAEQGPRPIDSS